MKHPAENQVAVLLILFTRTETLRQTFNVIRQARPAQLFLYQDGPRHEEDARKLEAARRIVADDQIDWECRVERNYHSANSGAWASNLKAQQWAFSLADKCIVIEDDSTPSASFIPFCREMLDRYEHDQRVTMIAGFNHEEITTGVPYDYLFTTVFSIWGWASWRRVVSQWDEKNTVVEDAFNMHQLEALVKAHGDRREMLRKIRKHHAAGGGIYETTFWSYNMLNSGLAIVPTRNMIHNSAVSAESAHFRSELRTLPRRMQRLLTMPSHDLAFPLRHPAYVIENVEYKQRVSRIMAWGHPWIKAGRSIEELLRNLRYGNFGQIASAVKFRLRKMAGRWNYQ